MIKHLGTTTINTDRLILRRYTKDDIKSAYNNFLSDINTIKDVDLSLEINYKQAQQSIENFILDYENKIYEYAIELKAIKEVIGSIQLTNIIECIGEAEIGFLLGSKYWNNGYMTEAIKAVLHHAIYDLNFEYIYGQCPFCNISSERVMQKCGMKFQFTVKDSTIIRGDFTNCKVYAIVRKDLIKENLI